MLVSVIIPTWNEEAHIEPCLSSAMRAYSTDDVEIVVADGSSADGTLDRLPKRVKVVHASRGRASQMNAGARASHGQALVFCHADTLLPERWREEVLAALMLPGVAGGAFQAELHPEVGLLRLFNRIPKPAHWATMFGDQAQFMSRAAFERVGGFQSLPLMEDLEMSRALRRIGRLIRVRARVLTSSRRFLERGVLRQSLQDAWLLLAYLFLGLSVQEAAQRYVSSREND